MNNNDELRQQIVKKVFEEITDYMVEIARSKRVNELEKEVLDDKE
jgi:hypothetical protein